MCVTEFFFASGRNFRLIWPKSIDRSWQHWKKNAEGVYGKIHGIATFFTVAEKT
jgi:hypothetical protein